MKRNVEFVEAKWKPFGQSMILSINNKLVRRARLMQALIAIKRGDNFGVCCMRICLKVAALGVTLLPIAAIAASFDPEVATRTYLDTIGNAARDKSDAYFEGGYWLILWGTLIAILTDLIMLHFGWSARFRDWAERLTQKKWLRPGLYVLPYILVSTLLGLPWTIYTNYFREKQYDLLSQSFGDWVVHQIIGGGLGIIIAPLIVIGLFSLLRKSPKRWWLWATGGATFFIAMVSMLFPLFLAPLFNTYTEMESGTVRDRIVAIAKANNVPADHIYVVDASKQSKRISANVSGLGPTTRISLNDNLLNRSTPDEVVAVMGHELGHYVLAHGIEKILQFSLLVFFGFWFLHKMTPYFISRYGAKWGVNTIDDPAVMPIFSILLSALILTLTPVVNTITRVQEVEADAFALKAARQPDAQSRVFLKLAEYRKMEPGPIEEVLFYDHPSGKTRIRMAMEWKAKHPAEVEGGAK